MILQMRPFRKIGRSITLIFIAATIFLFFVITLIGQAIITSNSNVIESDHLFRRRVFQNKSTSQIHSYQLPASTSESGQTNLTSGNISSKEDGEIIILYWTKWWGWNPLESIIVENPESCLYRCHYFYTRRDLLNVSDAVIFHPADISNDASDLPEWRSENQVWVVVHRETPIRVLRKSPKEILFNWTMTYRRDSDVYHPHFQTVKLPENQKSSMNQTLLNGKSKLVLWLASNCGGFREAYVRKLQEYIPVDIFGKCGDSTNPIFSQEGFTHISGPPRAWQYAQQHYKFYLAFENSNCSDYVTEKLRNPLMWDIVPHGTMGGANYDAIAPPDSYINVKDFQSPKELAEYLLHLDKKPGHYAMYFQWKLKYRINNYFTGWCNLCKKLREQRVNSTRNTVSYKEFWKWYYQTRVDDVGGVIGTKPGAACWSFK